jgi:hypothetical protein
MHRALILTVSCLSIVATPAHAQSTSWYRFSIGFEQSAQKNPAESPYVFSGFGYLAALGYGRDWSASSLDLSFSGGFGNLGSGLSRGEAHHGHSALTASYLRSITGQSMLGANLSILADITDQPYGMPFDATDQFGYGAITLGPALRSTFHVRHATVTNDATVPLVDAVELPYANLRMEGGVHLHLRTVATVQGLTDAVSYHIGGDGARNLTWTYRVSFLHFAAAQPRTFARQSVSMTINLPRGGDAP